MTNDDGPKRLEPVSTIETPPASVQSPPTSEERRELWIARHFVALFFGLIAAAVALVAWYFHG